MLTLLRKKRKGFSLLELVMVLAVASAISFMKFQELKQNQESIQASAVGQQIKQIGEAVNGYINIRYDKLSTLTNASTGPTDPGPRTCSTATNTCTISYQTLINEGLLPTTFTGRDAKNNGYNIILNRAGTSPNYIINGLVTTNNTWTEGSKIRYDLLGKAMQTAGIDSGMSKDSTTLSGYSGSWSANNASYSSITSPGLLGYRVGYDSAMYSIYLRRDGTLPMTGDLNMGTKSINNAQNITAAGTTTSGTLKSTGDTGVGGNFSVGGNSTMTGSLQVNNTINSTSNITAAGSVTAGNWVWAKNGYGDIIGLGGDAAGADYEIRLNANKPLTIYSPNSAGGTVVFQVGNDAKLQRLGTNGYNPNDLPSGWGGGIRTWDILAGGTIGILPNGVASGTSIGNTNQLAVSMSRAGDVNASGAITGGYIQSTGNLYAAGSAQVNGNITSSSQIVANGRLTTNEYLQVNGQASIGAACSPNGLIGRTSAGKALSCVNGVWTSINGFGRNRCYNVGNHDGRNFNPEYCNVGDYVAGLQFTGHRRSESTYEVICCTP